MDDLHVSQLATKLLSNKTDFVAMTHNASNAVRHMVQNLWRTNHQKLIDMTADKTVLHSVLVDIANGVNASTLGAAEKDVFLYFSEQLNEYLSHKYKEIQGKVKMHYIFDTIQDQLFYHILSVTGFLSLTLAHIAVLVVGSRPNTVVVADNTPPLQYTINADTPFLQKYFRSLLPIDVTREQTLTVSNYAAPKGDNSVTIPPKHKFTKQPNPDNKFVYIMCGATHDVGILRVVVEITRRTFMIFAIVMTAIVRFVCVTVMGTALFPIQINKLCLVEIPEYVDYEWLDVTIIVLMVWLSVLVACEFYVWTAFARWLSYNVSERKKSFGQDSRDSKQN